MTSFTKVDDCDPFSRVLTRALTTAERCRVVGSAGPPTQLAAARRSAAAASTAKENAADASPRLIVPVELLIGDRVLRFFSTLTTFGTAFDITLEELRIEALHPADEQTAQLVRSGTWLMH